MGRHWSAAGGLGLVAALVLTAPSASAAPPKHKKSALKQNKKAAPKPEPLEAKPEEPEPKPAEEAVKPEPEPPAKVEAEPTPVPAVAATLAPPPVVAPPTSEAATDAEAELGRREAARIAAGRIEVAVSASFDIGNRRFSYSDPVGDGYAPYRLPVVPMLSFGLEAYPAASSNVPVLRDLGFRGRVTRGFAFDSSTPQGVGLETSWTRFNGELRQRFLLPGAHPFEAGVFAGVDANYFGMRAKREIPALLPAARTVSLRFGLDARVLVAWRVSFMLGGGYLATTTKGEIYERFHNTSVAGLDADAGFAVRLVSGLEARLTGRYTRYFAKFKPRLGDAYVAGGALDELMQFGLGVRYAH